MLSRCIPWSGAHRLPLDIPTSCQIRTFFLTAADSSDAVHHYFQASCLRSFLSRCFKLSCLYMKPFYFIARWLNSAKYSLSFHQGTLFFTFLCPYLSPGRPTSLDGSFGLSYPLASIWIHHWEALSEYWRESGGWVDRDQYWSVAVFCHLRLQLLYDGCCSTVLTLFQ